MKMSCFKIIVSTFSIFLILIPAVVEANNHVCTARSDESPDSMFTNYAVCNIIGSDVYGTIYLRQGYNGTEVRYKLGGLTANKDHENGVHEFGDLFMRTKEDLCDDTGDLYESIEHGNETGLGQICADADGMANGVFVDQLVMLSGEYSIVGRSIVVHEAEGDDEILGCCVIGISDKWEPEDIEPSEPFIVGDDESESGAKKKRIAWVIYAFGFYFWKIFQ